MVAGTGGHGEQLKRLRRLLKTDSVTIIAEHALQWDFPDQVFRCDRVVDYHTPSFFKTAIRFVKVLYITLKTAINVRPKVVVSTGPALAVPVCLVCKVLGLTVIHIESWSRINSISNTTKLIRKFKLADTIVYQYPDSILAGQQDCEYWGHL